MTSLLSICIPTYNRPALLRAALRSIVPQIKEFSEEVELVVSDNSSDAETFQTVEWARQFGPIRYHRNEQNIGAIPNLLKLADELARGEFCWLLGDDELLRPGAVAKIVEILKGNSDLDYVYVNYSIDDFGRREGKDVTADDFRRWSRTGSDRLEEGRIGRWEQLLAEDTNCLTAMYSSVFRRSTWLKASRDLKPGELYASVEWTYTPTVIFARTMIGKPAYASGYPYVIMCGTESWSEFIPVAVLLRFHELLDLLIRNGVPRALVDRHRRRMLSSAEPFLIDVFCDRQTRRLESFSVKRFFLTHYRYRECWTALYRSLSAARAMGALRGSLPSQILATGIGAIDWCARFTRKVSARNMHGPEPAGRSVSPEKAAKI
jgi:glycosyltransferase involved in cell wall biosynthesis